MRKNERSCKARWLPKSGEARPGYILFIYTLYDCYIYTHNIYKTIYNLYLLCSLLLRLKSTYLLYYMYNYMYTICMCVYVDFAELTSILKFLKLCSKAEHRASTYSRAPYRVSCQWHEDTELEVFKEPFVTISMGCVGVNLSTGI